MFVYIYVCKYECAYVYREYKFAWFCKCIFILFFVIQNRQLLRHFIYFPSLKVIRRILILFTITPRVMFLYHYNTALSHGLLTGVYKLIYVWIYVLKKEWTSCAKPFGSIFLEINDFITKLFPFSFLFQLPLGSDVLSSCNTFMLNRKAIPFKKTTVILFRR